MKLVRYEEAAQHGDIGAKNRLGLCYEYGIGVKKDARKAQAMYDGSSPETRKSRTFRAAPRVSRTGPPN